LAETNVCFKANKHPQHLRKRKEERVEQQMKIKMMSTIATLVFVSLFVIACTDKNPSESASQPSPQTAHAEVTDPAKQVAEDVSAQMAGFWRLDYSNINNATIMILFADGSWESPGHLPTDHVTGGSFSLVNEEAGIYQLRLTVERSTSPHAEIGNEINNYYYDAQNDLLFTVLGSGEGNSNVGYIREHNATSFNESLFEAGLDLLEYDSYGGLHYSMPYVDIIAYMGPPDREHEPEYWDADGLYHWSVFYEAYGFMQISFVNETSQKEGGRILSILTSTYHSEKTVRGIRLGSTRNEVLEAYADVINAEDSRGNRIVAGSVYAGMFFFMDDSDKVEMIFIGVSTEWAMLQYAH